MAETVYYGKWRWHDMMRDLESAGAKGFTVYPLSVEDYFCGGTYKNKPWTVTWCKDKFLMLSFPEYDEDGKKLAHAFATVVEYQPFCRYRSRKTRLVTVEWDKVDPEGRYKELEHDPTVLDLTRIGPADIES